MAFLTSSFMRSFAVRMHLLGQRKLMNITLSVGKVQRQQRNLQTRLKNEQRFNNSRCQADYQREYDRLMSSVQRDPTTGQLTDVGKEQYQLNQSSIFTLQQEYQMNKSIQEDIFNQYYEAQLEPLKDLEEDLQIEKQQAETDVTFWKGVLDSYSSAIKEDIKSIVPDAG